MFKTDWICILTAGNTIDGREIKPQTLDEIAETYNPDVYNARINIEHQYYGPKLGSVLAVKAEESQEGGGKKLFAKLKPNDYFLYLIQQGQKLHTSAEIINNFAQTGKAYLSGLAVTDSPASLGTTEMKLSSGEKFQSYSTSEIIPVEKPSLFKKMFTDQKEDTMTEKAALECLTQIQAAQTTLNESIVTLSANIERIEQLGTTTSKEESATEEAGSYKEISEELTSLKAQLSETNKTVNNLTERLSQQTDEPKRPEATGETESEVVL